MRSRPSDVLSVVFKAMTERSDQLEIPPRVFFTQATTVAAVGLVVLFLELFGQPSRRGFFCDDDTIKYPYQSNTVSEGVVVLITLLVPLVIIIGTEFWKSLTSCEPKVKICWLQSPMWVSKMLTAYGYYMLGNGLCLILSNVGKFTIGRLRPHFLEVCNPDPPCLPQQPSKYVVDYRCQGVESVVTEARLSFPSGHASLALFTSIYLIIYLQCTKKWLKHGFLRGSLQFLLIVLCFWICLTRVMDNWHHWSDVFAGAVLGGVSAYLTATHLPGIERYSEKDDNEFLPLQLTNPTRPSSDSSQ